MQRVQLLLNCVHLALHYVTNIFWVGKIITKDKKGVKNSQKHYMGFSFRMCAQEASSCVLPTALTVTLTRLSFPCSSFSPGFPSRRWGSAYYLLSKIITITCNICQTLPSFLFCLKELNSALMHCQDLKYQKENCQQSNKLK